MYGLREPPPPLRARRPATAYGRTALSANGLARAAVEWWVDWLAPPWCFVGGMFIALAALPMLLVAGLMALASFGMWLFRPVARPFARAVPADRTRRPPR